MSNNEEKVDRAIREFKANMQRIDAEHAERVRRNEASYRRGMWLIGILVFLGLVLPVVVGLARGTL